MADSVFDELNRDITRKKTNQMTDNQNNQESNNFNPLQGETIKRDYAQNVGALDDIPVMDRVPEATYTAEPQPQVEKTTSNEGDNKQVVDKDKTTKKEDSQYNQPPANENMGELSKKDQIKSATMLTNAILKAYAEAWKIIGGTQKLSDEKVIDMVVKGELSYDVVVPMNNEDEEITLGEFISTYNGTIDVSTIVTQEFIDEVKDSMVNEFMRMGWGITDRQNIAQAFIRDSLTKGVALFQLKNTMNSILGVLKDNYKKQKEEVEEKYGVKDVEPNEPYTKEEKNYNNRQASPSFNNQTKEPVRNEKVSKVPPPPPSNASIKKEPSPPPPPPPNSIKKETTNTEKADISSPIEKKEMKQETNSLGDIVQKYSIESTPLMKEERSIVETIVTNENFDEIVKEQNRILQEQLENNSAIEESKTITETNTENFGTVVKAYEDNVHESEMINDNESQEQETDFQSENEGEQENQNQQEKPQNDE
jgi:hypothetical protein